MLPHLPFKVKLNDEYTTQKIVIGEDINIDNDMKKNQNKLVKQKTNIIKSRNIKMKSLRQNSSYLSRENKQTQPNFNMQHVANKNFKVNADIISRNVLIHVPDTVGKEKIFQNQMDVTSKYTEEIRQLNKMIVKEQMRIQSGQPQPVSRKEDFLTEVPDQKPNELYQKEEEEEEKEIQKEQQREIEEQSGKARNKKTKNRIQLIISGRHNQVPKFGQRAMSRQEHMQRVLNRENSQIDQPSLVPTLNIKKHPLQNYLNAYLANYKPFLKGERQNLPQILKNIINNINHPNQQPQNRTDIFSQKFQDLEENINNIFVKQQIQQSQ